MGTCRFVNTLRDRGTSDPASTERRARVANTGTRLPPDVAIGMGACRFVNGHEQRIEASDLWVVHGLLGSRARLFAVLGVFVADLKRDGVRAGVGICNGEAMAIACRN